MTSIGVNCSTSSAPCDILQPCENSGSCHNANTSSAGYICFCANNYRGQHCEEDHRPCKPGTCWNHGEYHMLHILNGSRFVGICSETSHSTFRCNCAQGWEGVHCETQMNFCGNEICQNRGICRSFLLNYSCECLGTSYSGRHCETTTNTVVVYQAVAKSFASVAISALSFVAIFVLVMDVLKYCFGIDPAFDFELETIKQQKKKKAKPGAPIRFVYVHASSGEGGVISHTT